MNNVYGLTKRTDPIEAASDWLAKIERGLSKQEEEALQKWLSEDPENQGALLIAARVWDRMSSLSRLAGMFPTQADNQQSRFPGYVITVMAVLLILVSVGFGAIRDSNFLTPDQVSTITENEQVFQTAVGEQSTVSLADGSQLTLNTNSIVRVKFNANQRLLFLERGEVYVEVAHDESWPLSVYINDKIVKAVGTAFNLKITDDQHIELMVTEGKVLVSSIDKPSIPGMAKDQSTVLPVSNQPVSAGEHIILGDNEEEVKVVKPEEIEVKLSWRGGKLVFRGESLETALTEIERYTPVEFIISDESLKKMRVVGLFKAGDVEGLLETLRENFDISYERVSAERIILTYNK